MSDAERAEPLFRLMEDYAEIVSRGLDERWRQLLTKMELYDAEFYEVAIGIVARQATLP